MTIVIERSGFWPRRRHYDSSRASAVDGN